jgi:hypothetical protein
MKLKRIFLALIMAVSVFGITLNLSNDAKALEEGQVQEQSVTEVDTEAELSQSLINGENVKLAGDIVVNQKIDIPAGVTSSLDLNGYNISGAFQTGSTTKHIYPFNNNGNLTITDSKGTGSISGRGIYNQADAILTINGVKVVGEDYNGGACVWSFGGEVYLNDAYFIGNTGCVSAQGYLEINGGTYICNSGIDDNGNILTPATYNIRAYAGLKITDGTFTSRHGVISLGGGTGVIEKGSYTVEFTAATTSNVVYVFGGADLTINDGEFISDNSNNKGDSGAAVLVSDAESKLTINDGTYVGMNGMISINDNTIINGGSFDTVFDYNHYGSIESAITEGTLVTIAGTTYIKSAEGLVINTFAASIGDLKFETVSDAVNYAKENNIKDLTITLIGDTSKESAIALNDSFDLCYTNVFDSIVINQQDSSKEYYIAGIYTGSRTNGGSFVFDGVNIVVIDQYMFEGNVKLVNNSIIKSVAEANCFIYYSETTIEPGSKLLGVIEDFRGGDLIIDGGSTDTTVDIIKKYANHISYWNSEPDKGIYDAMNKGIDNATGEWILFLNAGDILHDENVLSRIFNKEWKGTDVLWGEIKAINEDGIKHLRFDVPFYENKKFFYGMGFSHQGVFVRVEKAKELKFDLSYKCCADYNMMTLLYKNGAKFSYTQETIAIIEGRYGFSASNSAKQLQEVARILGVEKTVRFKFFFNKWKFKQFVKKIIKK